MPVDVRTSGFSLAYSLATALLGGFTPALCTNLIHITGNRAAPGLWMSFAAVLGLIAALVIPRPENALEDVGLPASRREVRQSHKPKMTRKYAIIFSMLADPIGFGFFRFILRRWAEPHYLASYGLMPARHGGSVYAQGFRGARGMRFLFRAGLPGSER